jgi:hypothetical protein
MCFLNILVTERYNQQSIRFLFFNITTTCTTYYYTITHIKLMNYYWPLCQRSILNSFRINVLVLSGILVRSFSMNIYYCCIKISFNSNPESFKILADEIVNSSMTLLIRVWRYKRGNQNPHIKEYTTQWRKEKVQKEKQRSTNLYIKLKVE